MNEPGMEHCYQQQIIELEKQNMELQGEVKELVGTMIEAVSEINSSPNEPDKMVCVSGWLDRAIAKHRGKP